LELGRRLNVDSSVTKTCIRVEHCIERVVSLKFIWFADRG
jgi:hypothetical protein